MHTTTILRSPGGFLTSWMPLLLIISTLLLNNPPVVSGDLSIIEKSTNKVVFTTASEFIRTSKCGTLYHTKPANLVVAQRSLDTCEDAIPSTPISYFQSVWSTVKSWVMQLADISLGINLQDPPWVLIISADVECADLQKILENAERAGYAAVLLGSNKRRSEIFNESSYFSGSKGAAFLDVHLINPWDIPVLSKYVQYTIQSPARVEDATCKEFYTDHERWLRSNLKRMSLKFWMATKNSFDSLVSALGKVTAKISNLLPRVKTNELYRCAVGLLYILIIASPFILMASLSDSAERPNDNTSGSGFYNYYREQSHQWAGGPRSQHRNHENTGWAPPPPRPPPSPPPPFRETYHRSLHAHLACLGLSSNERLTQSKVTSAYRQRSLLEHPDKHPVQARERQNEVFRLLTESKDFLLTICGDA